MHDFFFFFGGDLIKYTFFKTLHINCFLNLYTHTHTHTHTHRYIYIYIYMYIYITRTSFKALYLLKSYNYYYCKYCCLFSIITTFSFVLNILATTAFLASFTYCFQYNITVLLPSALCSAPFVVSEQLFYGR